MALLTALIKLKIVKTFFYIPGPEPVYLERMGKAPLPMFMMTEPPSIRHSCSRR